MTEDWKPVAGNYYLTKGTWLRDRLSGRLGVISEIDADRTAAVTILWHPNRIQHCSAQSLRDYLRRGRYTVDGDQHPYDKLAWATGGATANA
jgi:hypothetical protein